MITEEIGNTTFDLEEYTEFYCVGNAEIKSHVTDRDSLYPRLLTLFQGDLRQWSMFVDKETDPQKQ